MGLTLDEPARRRVAQSTALYARLLVLYPADFRRRFGDEMQLVFRDSCADACRTGGVGALWLRTLADVVRTAAAERAGSVVRDASDAIAGAAAAPFRSAAAVACLAVGVASATSVFALHVGLGAAFGPMDEPDRVVAVWPERDGLFTKREAIDLARRTPTLSSVAAFNRRSHFVLGGAGDGVLVEGAYASPSLFRTLGVEPLLGRGFERGEDDAGRDDVVVLSHRAWQKRFDGDPHVVGRELDLHGRKRRVLGVMPESFAFPSAAVELWVPLPVYASAPGPGPNARFLSIVGRLSSDGSVEEAQREVRESARAWRTNDRNAYSEGFEDRATVVPLHHDAAQRSRPGLAIVWGGAGALWLLSWLGVAGILAAGTTPGRCRIGAAALVAAPVVVVALTIAKMGASTMTQVLAPLFPEASTMRIDPDGTAFAIATAVGGALLALAVTTVARARRRIFLAAPILVVCALVLATAVAYAGVRRIQSVDPGFDAAGVRVVALQMAIGPVEPDALRGCLADALEGVRSLGGVKAAGAIQQVPMGGSNWTTTFSEPGLDLPESTRPAANYRVVSTGYFEAMRISITSGRAFDDADRAGAEPVVIVNEAFVARYWPHECPIGRRLGVPLGPDAQWLTVVGVAGDVRYRGLGAAAGPEIYRPHAQHPQSAMTVVARGNVGDDELRNAIRRGAGALVGLGDSHPLREFVRRSSEPDRVRLALLLVVATVGTFLAIAAAWGFLRARGPHTPTLKGLAPCSNS